MLICGNKKTGHFILAELMDFNYFNPRDLDKNNIPPNIVITDFKIGNKTGKYK